MRRGAVRGRQQREDAPQGLPECYRPDLERCEASPIQPRGRVGHFELWAPRGLDLDRPRGRLVATRSEAYLEGSGLDLDLDLDGVVGQDLAVGLEREPALEDAQAQGGHAVHGHLRSSDMAACQAGRQQPQGARGRDVADVADV